MKTISIKDKLSAYPIIATGERWPHRTEGEAEQRGSWGNFFGRFPFLEGDPRYADFGKCPDVPGNPPPGARGGGLWPTLHVLADGTILCVATTGVSHKGGPGGAPGLSVSKDRGKSWSPYRVIGGAAMGVADDGALVLIGGVADPEDPERQSRQLSSYSEDGGDTWSQPKPIDLAQLGDDLPSIGPFGPILRVAPSTMAVNVRGGYPAARYARQPDLPERKSYLLWSYDSGRTFTELTFIADKTETSFVPLDADNWICYSRVSWLHPEIGRSADGGRTWGQWTKAYPDVEFRTDISSIAAPGTILRLASGKVAVIHTWRDHPFGIRAFVSRDGGRSFDYDRQYILTDSFWTYDSGYPCSICYDDGTMVTAAYTILDNDHPEWGTCAVAYVYHESVFD